MDFGSENLQPVIEFASKCHAGQTRKTSGLPYIVHPMAVLSKLADWEIGCYKCWKAALCHDVLEDCPVTFDELVAVIGLDAANIVQELTFHVDRKSDVDPKIQKRDYMRTFASKSVHALVIKVADRVCNTVDFISTTPDYAPKYWKQADDLFNAMMSRGEEIMAEFGRSSFPRMKYSRTCLNPMLVR
jgi:guanosine-3',5'-bis(diphosphate) 3'-pyrophosphohydrolase